MMQADELRTLRKGMALTQEGLAAAIGMSRKAIVEMEAGRAKIEPRTEQIVRAKAKERQVVKDDYSVEQVPDGRYAVIRRTTIEMPRTNVMFYTHSNVMLYGLFRRRDHAYRWNAALMASNNARNTRQLLRERAAAAAAREAPA